MAGDDDVLVNDFVEQEETSIMDSQKDDSSKWTNEKHSLYLKSIEASFVNQLYNSLDMQTSQTQNPFSSDAVSTLRNLPNTCISSGQFKVLQRGRWSNKCFKKEKSHVKDADRPRVSSGNPWIQHFTNGLLKKLSSTSTSLNYPVTDSRLHDQDTGCSNTEVTDQNFVEDTTCSRKRTRTSKITHARSSNDQVVPGCTSEIPDSYDCSKK
ncbi:cold-regulated protein 27-like [Bidens hawaiensis]|uniref:cold-regulated protein 27-like n=1 Tax=Bidens hawaiensis TaxID=980011 RepID=UPI00404A2954